MTPDGSRIVTGSPDGTARVWNVKTGTEQAVLKGHLRLSVHRDSERQMDANITGSFDETARIWNFFPNGQALIDYAKAKVQRCLTLAERKRYHLILTPPLWCGKMEKWPYNMEGSLIEIKRLISEEMDKEAEIILTSLRLTHPEGAKQIEEHWANKFVKRGVEALENNNDDDAKALFENAMKLDSGTAARTNAAWAEAYVDRGGERLLEGRQEEARALFEEALKRDAASAVLVAKVWANYHVRRGLDFLARNLDAEAKPEFEFALKLDPSDRRRAGVHRAIARHWYLQGKPAQGLADAEQAVVLLQEHTSDAGFALDTRGQIYLALGRIDEACSDFDKAISMSIGGSRISFDRGQCREMKGQTEAAIADYRKALGDDIFDGQDKSIPNRARERIATLEMLVRSANDKAK